MTPGLRLFVAPGLLFVVALVSYLLPRRMSRTARLLAMLGVAAAGALLLSDGTLILPSARVERNLGDFAPGVPLVARADPPALVICLLASAIALLALAERRRQPLERSALLLCLAGTYVAALAGNAVLLFGGIEIADVGALLLAAGATARLRLRSRVAFAVQSGSSLGLLLAAVSLQSSLQTSDFSAIPVAAMGWGLAGPWAFTGAVRLLAPAALPGRVGRAASTAWLPVGAIPCGLLVLLRLVQVTGTQLATGVADLLIAGGLAAALLGAIRAARAWRVPAAAGRGLAVAMAGEVIALSGIGTAAALSGMAALAFALILGLAAAPAWGVAGDQGSGRAAAWVRAAALASMGGLPIGYGMSAVLLGTGSVAAAGLPTAVVAIFLGGAALVSAGAGAMAARAALAQEPPTGRVRGPRPDAVLVLGAGFLAALLPGLVQSAFVERVASAIGTVQGSVDVATTRLPGAGWAGGYLTLAVLVALLTAWSASSLAQWRGAALDEALPAGPAAPSMARGSVWGRSLLLRNAGRATRWLAASDGWLAEQPGLALVVAGVIACLFIFR
ncbi:MAG TPA: hypothetical protein VN193_17500 [Candidatus Angelobacter sp.]|jgi:hypothetical protein|nr:hypothetical protein [Candidatus Angelobacter sp.]